MFDLIIAGGGPAGLTAGIYAQRALLETLLIEKQMPGGQVLLSTEIENYPGFTSIAGTELMEKFKEHAKGLGLAIETDNITKIEPGKEIKVITNKKTVKAKSVIITSGAHSKKLNAKGVAKFIGKGVSYCATCDGFFFKDKIVAVVGGGNAAVEEALLLSKMCKQVYIIHRRDEFRADAILVDRAKKAPNVECICDTVVDEIIGTQMVEKLKLKNVKSSLISELDISGIFIYVGKEPDTGFIDVKKDAGGFILTDENMETSVNGIFAAGDCRSKTLRQVTTAVGDAATAAHSAVQYINAWD